MDSVGKVKIYVNATIESTGKSRVYQKPKWKTSTPFLHPVSLSLILRIADLSRSIWLFYPSCLWMSVGRWRTMPWALSGHGTVLISAVLIYWRLMLRCWNLGITKFWGYKVSLDWHGEPHHLPLCPGLFFRVAHKQMCHMWWALNTYTVGKVFILIC